MTVEVFISLIIDKTKYYVKFIDLGVDLVSSTRGFINTLVTYLQVPP